MRLRELTITLGGLLAASGTASAGGLFLPGAGAVSSSRAGAGTASADDGEALALNPAGLASAGTGTVLTISATVIDYVMQFTRAGTYDVVDSPAGESVSYAGQPYPTIKNTPKPPLGIGAAQPVPVIAVVTDFGTKRFHFAAGLYAPNAYPFRNMTVVNGQPWAFDAAHFDAPPPPTRYDIIEQEAAVLLPSIAVSYRINDQFDVGARVSAGFASLKSTVALWGTLFNYEEFVKQDAQIAVKATDNFIPAAGFGATFHATPALDISLNYTSEVDIHAKGTAQSTNGPDVVVGTAIPVIVPPNDANALCDKGGTAQALKACVDLGLPMTAQLGARYKFLDAHGRMRGDLELDLDWENWSAVSDYHVTVDATIVTATDPDPNTGIQLKPNVIPHGFQDTYAARLGGSYVIPTKGEASSDGITLRGGVSYDTAAARTGWERVDLDGAARTTIAGGASYAFNKTRIDLGFGVILEGTRTTNRNCNPTQQNQGCAGNGMDQPIADRQGPDPVTPILDTNSQTENPVNQGTMVSHYIMFMLGVTQRF